VVPRCTEKMFLKKHFKFNFQNTLLKRFAHNYLNLEVAGETLKFPHVWLRDNCRCEKCYHHSANSRFIEWSKFDLNVKPKDVSLDANTVKVIWEDGHKSSYQLNWLKFRSFTPESRKTYDATIYRPTKKPWNKDTFDDVITKFDYNDILKSNKLLYDWIYNLSVYGVALIQNAPDSSNALNAIIERIAFPKRTHCGSKYAIQTISDSKVNHLAYIPRALQLHTDLSYYEYGPGVTLLHCEVQTEGEGGANIVSDAYYVTEYIKQHHPDVYKVLTDTEVEWRGFGEDNGTEFFKLYRSPVINLNKHGKLSRIHFSIPQRSSFFPVNIEAVAPWYRAYTLFLKLNHQHAVHLKMKAGEILTFDNLRTIHGRNSYNDTTLNQRKLHGAFLDWDEVYCKLRCLTVKKKNLDYLW
jgi:gamma-butyrobetaine dioxygenase